MSQTGNTHKHFYQVLLFSWRSAHWLPPTLSARLALPVCFPLPLPRAGAAKQSGAEGTEDVPSVPLSSLLLAAPAAEERSRVRWAGTAGNAGSQHQPSGT